VLRHAYEVLGLHEPAGGDGVFQQPVIARIIEPTSKLDSLRVLEEVDVDPPLYRTVTRRLRAFPTAAWRQSLAKASARHTQLGPATLVLYDVTTLYFETDTGDGSVSPASRRNAVWSRRSPSACSPTRPVSVDDHAFEGSNAETTAMLP
jgi:hypothetical protein